MGSMGDLVVSLEARIAQFTQEMATASQQTRNAMRQMSDASNQAQRSIQALENAVSRAKQTIGGLASAVGTAQLIAYSDAFTNIESKIRLTTSSASELAKVENQLFDIAQRQHSAMEPVVALYSRLNTASGNLSASQKEIIHFTEGVSASLRQGGASTGEAYSAMLQLSQAMSNVTVQGAEFNALQDAAPGLLITAAKNIQGLGGDVSKLRSMMLDGKLESKLFFDAILKGTDETIAKAGTMTLTIGQSLTDLNSGMMKFVGEGSKTSGAGLAIAESIQVLSKNLNVATNIIAGLMVYKLSEWALLAAVGIKAKTVATMESNAATLAAAVASNAERTANIAAMQALAVEAEAKALSTAATAAELRATMLATTGKAEYAIASAALAPANMAATAAADAHALALANLARAEGVAAASTSALSAALAFVGGPIGAITIALGLATTAWLAFGDSTEKGSKKASFSARESTDDILKGLNEQITKLQERNRLFAQGPSAPKQSDAEKRIAENQKTIEQAKKRGGMYSDRTDEENQRTIRDLSSENSLLMAGIEKRKAEEGKGERAAREKQLQDWRAEKGTNQQRLEAALEKAKTEWKGDIPTEVLASIKKQFTEKPDAKAASLAKAAIKEEDLTAKNKVAGEVKEIEDALAQSQSAYQFNNQYVAELRSQDLIDLSAYNDYRKAALENNLANIKNSYDKQIAIEEAYRNSLKKGSAKEAAQTRIDALQDKAKLAAQEAMQQSAMLDLSIQGSGKSELSKLKFNAVDKNDPESIAANKLAKAEKDYLANVKIIESQRKDTLESLAEYHALVEQNEADHEERLRLIHQETADAKAKNYIQSVSLAQDTAEQLYQVMKKSGHENSVLAKAAFLLSKGLAATEIMMNTEVAASKAGAQLGVFGIPQATMIRVQGYASAGMVAGMAIAEASAAGGYDIPAGKNPVVQAHEEEMILPSKHAKVIRDLADGKMGSGSQKGDVTIINQTTGRIDTVQETTLSNGQRALIIKEAVNAVAAAMRDPNSQSHRSVKDSFGISTARF